MNFYQCGCGELIASDNVWNGLVYRVRFFPYSGNQEIDHCPGCGEWVGSWLKMGLSQLVIDKSQLYPVDDAEMPDSLFPDRQMKKSGSKMIPGLE